MNLDYSLLLKYKFLFATAIVLVILVLTALLFLIFSAFSPTQNTAAPSPAVQNNDQQLPTRPLPGESGNMTPDEAEQVIELREQAESAYQQRLRRLPFLAFLPYQTGRFLVNIAATTDAVTITTYGATRAEHLRYRDEAASWLRANGANMQTLPIRYEPANP